MAGACEPTVRSTAELGVALAIAKPLDFATSNGPMIWRSLGTDEGFKQTDRLGQMQPAERVPLELSDANRHLTRALAEAYRFSHENPLPLQGPLERAGQDRAAMCWARNAASVPTPARSAELRECVRLSPRK